MCQVKRHFPWSSDAGFRVLLLGCTGRLPDILFVYFHYSVYLCESLYDFSHTEMALIVSVVAGTVLCQENHPFVMRLNFIEKTSVSFVPRY